MPFNFIAGIVVCVAATIIVRTIADAAVRYAAAERGDGLADDQMRHIDQRLDRMQSAIDAIAIEMERVGERHRYTDQLLADVRSSLPDPDRVARLAGAQGKVVTPH